MPNELARLRETIARQAGTIRDLQAALNQSNDGLACAFRLAPASRNILGLLLAVPLVTGEMVQQRLGLASDAKVAMHRLKKALAPFNIEVKSQRHIGYWLDAETKERIRLTVERHAPWVDVAIAAA